MIKYCELCTEHGLVGIQSYFYSTAGMNRYVREACDFLNIEYELIMGQSRKRYICDNRHMIMSYLRVYPKFRCVDIAKELNKDHTTVIHAEKANYSLCFTDHNFKKRYLKLVDHLNSIQ